MCLIVVHALCVFGSDLCSVVMSCLVAFHVDYWHALYASILWLYTLAKYVLIRSCKLQEIS
jgi:hypothetical protein